MNLINLFRRLWLHIEPLRRKQLLMLLLVMVLASFAEVLSIGAVLPFLSVLMAPKSLPFFPNLQSAVLSSGLADSHGFLLIFTSTFILAAIFAGLMRLVLLTAQTRLGFSIGADLSHEIYRKTLYQPYSVHVSRNSSEVIAGISSKTGSVITSVLLPLLTIVSSSMILLTILGTLLAIDPVVALVVFCSVGGFYSVIIAATKKRLKNDSWRISQATSQVIKALQEGLGGIRDVLLDGSQVAYCNLYYEADLPLRKAHANIQIIAAAPRFLIESFGMVLIAIVAYVLANREDGVLAAIPLLGALAVGAQRMLPAAQQLYNSWAGIRGGEASLRDVLDLLDQKVPRHVEAVVENPIVFNSLIKLEGVSFRYSDKSPWVLKDINLVIPKAARVGFIGATGGGKSTLIDIIMGLLVPTEGKLVVDNISIEEKNCRAWQTHIAHVPQNIFLADISIAENIALGVPSELIDFGRIRSAAKKAQISETIESWAEQYDTVVGERGIRLSGGQRQRIGIARALYKRSDVIVFDEATSALDENTENSVMEAINATGDDATILIVAHRLSTLKNCDLIFELDRGLLKEIGDYKSMVSWKNNI